MNICVIGWYFDDEFYASLWRVKERYPVFVVAHKEDEFLKNCDLPFMVSENIGLEWGAYAYYIKNIWNDNDSVLFMHDDIHLDPIVENYEIKPGEIVFNVLSKIEYDQVYIFQNRREDVVNMGHHGRMLFISERVLKILKEDIDLLFDPLNKGYTGSGPKPDGIKHHNYGVMTVHEKFQKIQQQRQRWQLLKKIYAPNIDMGYRGKYGEEKASILNALEIKI